MKLSIIHSAIFFSLLSLPLVAISIDPRTSTRIIDTFKKEQYELLFESEPFGHTGVYELFEKEYTLRGIEGMKERIEEMNHSYREKKDQITLRKNTLQETLYTLESSIADTAASIKKTERGMKEKMQRVQEYKDLSQNLSIRVETNRATILSYLANIYSEGNLLYNDTQDIDIFRSLIITSGKIDDLLNEVTYKSLISILGQKFIEEYRLLIKEYALIRMRIQEEFILLERDKEILERQKSQLNEQRIYREQLLEATKGQESLYEEYINTQLHLQKELELSWQNVADSYTVSLDTLLKKNNCTAEKKAGKDIDRCNNILAFYKNERALKRISFSTGGINDFTWPVKSLKEISAYFRDPYYYRIIGSQHDAIDIPIPQGSDVLATMDGYIQYVLPPSPGSYSFLAVKHPHGYVSVYGHLSEVLVSPYQFVRKGDIIAKSGGSPGTDGAGPMTTGPHLHFELWKDRSPVDPLRYIDISYLDYQSIPSRYQDKYIADIIERMGTGVDTSKFERKFLIKGNSEEDRQKYLLSTYATPDFDNYNLWIDVAIDSKIDPSFLMCVGLAETTLGNYLKTSYNIGNVGNTDSGDITSFANPRQGIEWMAITFNNKYLGQYTQISDLSRWGNPDGVIYASSNANWHNNIIRCLSALKGRFVEDNYEFRIP